jgi:hypothetical protein
MKKVVLITMLIAGLAFISTPADAFDIGGYTGDLEFKFSDFTEGNLYTSSSNGYGNADKQEDAWSIFKVSTLKTATAQTLWWDGKDGEELTGIFYGLDDDAWTVDPVTGHLNVQSVGGYIDLYLDTTPDFDPTGGPDARNDDGDPTTYPTVTDGELFLRLALVPGIKYGNGVTDDDHITYDNDLDATTTPFTGDGAFYLAVIGGSAADMFDSNKYILVDDAGNVTYADFYGNFVATATADPDDDFGWLATSEDPIEGKVVPEPTSMLLLGTGLLGLAGFRRKK